MKTREEIIEKITYGHSLLCNSTWGMSKETEERIKIANRMLEWVLDE